MKTLGPARLPLWGWCVSGGGLGLCLLAGVAMAQEAGLPADWLRHEFRGASFALPAGWTEVQNSDGGLGYVAGTTEAQKGPGFGVTLSAMPRSMVEGLEPLGEVTLGGWTFNHFRGSETPDGAATIEGDVLVSTVPVLENAHIAIIQSAYDDPIATHEALFAQIMATVQLPASDGPWREPVLGGVMQAPYPAAWRDYHAENNHYVEFKRIDPRGAISLIRYDAAVEDWESWTYHVEDRSAGERVTFMNEPARLYDWAKPQDSYGDDSDDLERVRLYVMETCLPGGTPVAVLIEGMAEFQTSGTVQNFLDGLIYTPGEAAVPCAESVFPVSETVDTDGARRSETGNSQLVRPVPQPDWPTQTLDHLSFGVPPHWTGGPVEGGLAYMSSGGEYELYVGTTPDAPIQTDDRPEVVIDGQRFVRIHQAEGENLISLAPIAEQGHLVFSLRGGSTTGPGFLDILATMKIDVPVPQPVKARGLGGLVDYTVPVGWSVTETPESVTLMAQDGRGYFAIVRGAALLAPDGLAGQVPLRQLGIHEDIIGVSMTGYGWEGSLPEFVDKGVRDIGYHRLWISDTCLPGGEAFAIAFGGVRRFRDGKTLARLKSDLEFHLPEGATDCDPRSAGLILDPETDMVIGPMGAVAAPEPAAEPAPIVAALPENTPESVPEQAPEIAAAPVPQLVPPAPPVIDVPPPSPMPEPDSFVEEDGGYTRYTNARYGTTISYPGTYFLPGPPPGSGDGRSFASADGAASFLVFAQYDAMGLGQAGLQQFDRDNPDYGRITRSAEGPGWYELAGITGALAFYRKALISQDSLVQVFEITYPQSLSVQFEPVVSYMAASFGPMGDLATPQGDGEAAGYADAPDDTEPLPTVDSRGLFTPARGTALRKELADTARIPIEEYLQQPVIFVISVLRTDGTWAFLQGRPVRPNGAPINWKTTPYASEIADGVMSDVAMVLMLRTQRGWQVVNEAMGPTDVAWYDWLAPYGLPEVLFMP